jgi:hypothetical protein
MKPQVAMQALIVDDVGYTRRLNRRSERPFAACPCA